MLQPLWGTRRLLGGSLHGHEGQPVHTPSAHYQARSHIYVRSAGPQTGRDTHRERGVASTGQRSLGVHVTGLCVVGAPLGAVDSGSGICLSTGGEVLRTGGGGGLADRRPSQTKTISLWGMWGRHEILMRGKKEMPIFLCTPHPPCPCGGCFGGAAFPLAVHQVPIGMCLGPGLGTGPMHRMAVGHAPCIVCQLKGPPRVREAR